MTDNNHKNILVRYRRKTQVIFLWGQRVHPLVDFLFFLCLLSVPCWQNPDYSHHRPRSLHQTGNQEVLRFPGQKNKSEA